MINVGIVGGGGYTGGELLRILLNHPKTAISYVHSQSQAGKPVTAVHEDLEGSCSLLFTDQLDLQGIDVLFLCMGHGQSTEFMARHVVPPSVAVIDLGNDFRLDDRFVYGLPELNKAAIRTSKRIANPGCFATAIQLALLPLAHAQLLGDEVHIQAITGSTGAGQAPSATTHFSWRHSNISAYKVFNHQHLGEIRQSLTQLQSGLTTELNFIPLRGDFTRGIFASLYLNCTAELDEVCRLYEQYYLDDPFTVVSPRSINLKQVVNTNKCLLSIEKHGNKVVIFSAIDNLVKGASGQAVQNMNLLFGLPETTGLLLKSVAF